MRELVDHDVVAPVGRLAGVADVAPRQHHRAAFHGLAGQHLVVLVHDAVVVDDLAPRQHRVGVHDDADEAVVPVEAQPQHRQAGLRGDGHGHGVGDVQAVARR